jgi:MFS family permease
LEISTLRISDASHEVSFHQYLTPIPHSSTRQGHSVFQVSVVEANGNFSYLDRINVSNAQVAGMQEDLNMSDVQWSAGISLFYVGYIIGQVPGNIWIAKSKPRYILPVIMLAWSVIILCTPAIKTPWAFMLCRFLVGLAEGPFLPAVTLVTSSWYVKSESSFRMGIWHAGNIISNVISGFLAAGILSNMDNVAGVSSWRWFFIIEGKYYQNFRWNRPN